MNSSQFMDKQIMGLAGSPSIGSSGEGEMFDLMNPQEELSNGGGGSVLKKEEILLPSYDFQPIRTVGSSSLTANINASSGHGSSNLRYSTIMEPHEPPKVSHEKERDAYTVATVSEIDRTVKKYADNLLHTLEGISSRLSQLESRTRNLEKSVNGLKITVGNNNGSTDGKLRQLENIVREVQTGIQVLRDKQEIAEAQLLLAKLQQSSAKPDHYQPSREASNPTTQQPDSRFQEQTTPPASYQPRQLSTAPPQQPPPPPPATNAMLPPPQQIPAPQFPSQLPQTQLLSLPSVPREPSYFPSQQQSQRPPQSQPQPQPQHQTQPPLQPQHYQLPQYSRPMPPPQPPLPHQPVESAPYMQPPSSQIYPPNIHQPPLTQPRQFYGLSSGQLTSFSDGYRYSGSSSRYSSSAIKPLPFTNSPSSPDGGGSSNSNSYSRLPTAKLLPQAVSTGPSSGGSSGARVPIDDVVDKVATMGFSRDQVRMSVRKLTENGQSVDLNVVLDTLMNGGGERIQPQRGWFGR